MLSQLGLLAADELESTIVSEFNPVRCGFTGKPFGRHVRQDNT